MPSDNVTSPEIRIRELRVHEWELYRAVRLAALTDSPDAFGSVVAEEVLRPQEHWQQRLERGSSDTEMPLIVDAGGLGVGLAWGRVAQSDASAIELNQLWIAPSVRGRGLGRALVSRIIAWARSRNAEAVILDVTCGDTPAMRLYSSLGFRASGAPQPL
jgi:GNAT superfamily N-acetyltransferase